MYVDRTVDLLTPVIPVNCENVYCINFNVMTV